MTAPPVRLSTAAILARKARTATGLVTGFVDRLLNTYWRGASLKRRTILLHGDVFDTDWYIEHNPGLGLTPETAANHFFATGLESGRQARLVRFAEQTSAAPHQHRPTTAQRPRRPSRARGGAP